MPDRHILLDPFVLAVPVEVSAVDKYVEGLLTWLPVLNTRRHEASCFEKVVEVLVQENRYPTYEALAPLFARSGTQEYTIYDILQMTRVMVETEPYFESFVNRRAAAATDVNIEPALLLGRLGTRLADVTSGALVLTAVAHEQAWCTERTYWATIDWPLQTEWIEVNSHVSVVELLDRNIEEMNRVVTARLRVLTAAEEVKFCVELVDVYTEPSAAIELVLHRLRQFDCQIPDSVVVTYGPQFLSSLKQHNFQAHPPLLETVFERAAFAAMGRLNEISGAKLHPRRTSLAANAPQEERADGAKLWRCMISKSGAGYRLHYWSLPAGGVELDAVMVESVT